MKFRPLFFTVALLFGALPGFAQTEPADGLTRLRELKVEFATEFSAERDEAPILRGPKGEELKKLPPCTIVKLRLKPAEGSNIQVQIWLPEPAKWNGRLVGLGNGGAAGSINPRALAGPCSNGFAAVTTDLGTSPNPDSGINNREVWKDFGFRATHLMTVAAKQCVLAFYGKAPEYSYFQGGSTGGQQALQEAQRYPEDYDGIVASVPAHCRTPLHAYFLWNDQILQKCPLTKEQEVNVIAAANAHLAAREIPAAAGQFVSDPRHTREDVEAVIALARKKDATLTDAHAAALRQLFDGPRHATTGERIFGGIPLGSTISQAHGHLYLFRWVFGPDKPLEEINFGADLDTYTAALGPYLNAENADLSAFAKRGGRLLITTGAVDSVVPPGATIDYYERVIEQSGGLENAQAFCRLYVIPGMAHGGGPGINAPPNLLEALQKWREQGKIADSFTGRRLVDGKVTLELPIYAYPLQTGWDSATSSFRPVSGSRGGVARVAPAFRPPAAQ